LRQHSSNTRFRGTDATQGHTPTLLFASGRILPLQVIVPAVFFSDAWSLLPGRNPIPNRDATRRRESRSAKGLGFNPPAPPPPRQTWPQKFVNPFGVAHEKLPARPLRHVFFMSWCFRHNPRPCPVSVQPPCSDAPVFLPVGGLCACRPGPCRNKIKDGKNHEGPFCPSAKTIHRLATRDRPRLISNPELYADSVRNIVLLPPMPRNPMATFGAACVQALVNWSKVPMSY